MSELKGQLLGMIVVLSIFAIIGVTLVGAFKANANNIASQLSNGSLISAIRMIKSAFTR